ncbi:MAG: glycerol-3-phosphate dehydrogenase/oxidase [Acidimicrobiales bacterium]
MGAAVRLSVEQRAAALERLATEEFDILVVGGGVTGAGVALDAVTRGLSVALVEAGDYASGTASRSSKLIHGGLRYLERLDLRLVREALRERSLILEQLCPHLARPVPFLYPLKHHVWERLYVGAGIALYDALGGKRNRTIPGHRHLSKGKALRAMPSLRADALVGAIQYFDGQVDDARHTLTLVRTAADRGAVIANSLQATGVVQSGGAVSGITAVDLESGHTISIRGQAVISAAGVFTEQLQALTDCPSRLHIQASKGVHLVVPWDRINSTTGLITKTSTSVLFVIPWNRSHWLIGTTDTPWSLDLAHPAASARDIDYLLEQVNKWLSAPLSRADVTGVFVGLRPLLAEESDATSKLSREHAVVTSLPGFTLVAGGKYTTYRVMARDAVDAAVGGWTTPPPESCTQHIPLLGAEGYHAAWAARTEWATRHRVDVGRMERLLERYGTLVDEVLAPIRSQPDLADPLDDSPGYLRAEVLYAASHEGALHLDDVMTRRTRISIETKDRGVGAAQEVAGVVAPVLGWSAADVEREVVHYRARVSAERESQEQPDDLTADAARLGAPDVRLRRTF